MDLHELFKALNRRRHRLGMSYECLAERTGLSVTTIFRILSGKQHAAAISSVFAILRAMDMKVGITAQEKLRVIKAKQAEHKAKQLVGMLQGTSGLEGQGLDEETIEEMKAQTVHELLSGSKRKLWGK